jgi:hypothetical protein
MIGRNLDGAQYCGATRDIRGLTGKLSRLSPPELSGSSAIGDDMQQLFMPKAAACRPRWACMLQDACLTSDVQVEPLFRSKLSDVIFNFADVADKSVVAAYTRASHAFGLCSYMPDDQG